MKKRLISLLLTLLMVVSLLPIGAAAAVSPADAAKGEALMENVKQFASRLTRPASDGNSAPAVDFLKIAALQKNYLRGLHFEANDSGAVPLASGTGAFNYLKQWAMNKGVYSSSDNSYAALLSQAESDGVKFDLIVVYYSSRDYVMLVMRSTMASEPDYVNYTSIYIPSDLSMPYPATQITSVGDYDTSALTSLNSSFTSGTDLVLTNGEGDYTNQSFKDLYVTSLALMLAMVEDEYASNSGYSIADLGFTALAAELRGGSPTPTPTPTPVSKPVIKTQPKSVTVDPDSSATFSVSASGKNLRYQWQFKPAGSDQWSDSGADGAKTSSITVKAKASRDGQQYRCIVSNSAGKVVSNAAVLNVRIKPVIKSQPKDVSVAVDKTATFSVSASGKDLTYQWQFRAPGTKEWHNSTANGAETAKISVKATESRNGQQYRCVVKNKYGSVTSSAATLTVKKTAPTKNPFKDVKKDAYYYEPVLWAVENGITNGTSATTFSPDQTCTRGQVVTFLWRASGSPEPQSTKNPFKDVSKDAYYYKAVLWAVEQGITNGTSARTFSPNAPCTRAHVVTFLYRSEGAPKVSAKNPFKDVKSSEYFYDAVLWAVKNEITKGTSATTFSPGNPCTRGQIVTFLYRDKT